MPLVTWDRADDWDRFAPEVVNTISGGQVLTLGAANGEGTVDGGATGDGNDRRVFRYRGPKLSDVEARLDFRLTLTPEPTPQTGITIHRDAGPPLTAWTNIVFEANAQLLLGAWAYNGTTLTTNQQQWTHTLRDNGAQVLAGDETRVRVLKVRLEGRRLRMKQWMRDQPEPAWQYDDALPTIVTGKGPGDVGVIFAHTGNSRGDVFVDSLSIAQIEDYVSLSELKRWLRFDADKIDTAHPDDGLMMAAIEGTCRWIERRCKRVFRQVHEARVFEVDDPYNVSLGHYNDLTGVIALSTDADGDGVFETVWPSSAYEVRSPQRSKFPEDAPANALRALGQSFPQNTTLGGRIERIKVDGLWGWESVPDPIRQAAKIMAARIVKRKEAPEGVMGMGQFGVVRVSRSDPDVNALIEPYRLRSLG